MKWLNDSYSTGFRIKSVPQQRSPLVEFWHKDFAVKVGGQVAECNWILFLVPILTLTTATPLLRRQKCMEKNRRRQGWKWVERNTFHPLLKKKKGEWNYSSLEKTGNTFQLLLHPSSPSPSPSQPRADISFSLFTTVMLEVKNGGSFSAQPHYFKLYNLEPWYKNQRLYLKYL